MVISAVYPLGMQVFVVPVDYFEVLVEKGNVVEVGHALGLEEKGKIVDADKEEVHMALIEDSTQWRDDRHQDMDTELALVLALVLRRSVAVCSGLAMGKGEFGARAMLVG